MRPMGFPDSVVRKRVRELLKVYGSGDEGWYFIEECSYKLLIETLLDDGHGLPGTESAGNLLTDGPGNREMIPQDGLGLSEPESAGGLLIDGAENRETIPEDGHWLPEPESAGNLLTDGADSSKGNGLGSSSEQQDSEDQGVGGNSCLTEIMHKTTENHSQDVAEAKSELELAPISVPTPVNLVGEETTNPDLEYAPISVLPIDPVTAKITRPELDFAPISVPIPIDHVSAKITKSELDAAPISVTLPGGHVATKTMKSEPGFAPFSVPMPTHRVAAKRIRKPCFGWISDDGDDDDEFILLRPAAAGTNLS
ncbi:OLC1v1026756C3 [Oldenlandia corymbosa var. corymbosa]|nr:OLC1v1026756C3 [Oldenlandia corymbosa var. corymbosa]